MLRLTRLIMVTAVAAGGLLALTIQLPAQQVDPLQAAIAAMGATQVNSIRYGGFGATYAVGQSPSPREAWPRVTLKQYEANIDYVAVRMQVQLTREQGAIPPRGGGAPFTGEQRSMVFLNGRDAWDLAVPNPPPPPRGGPPPAPTAGPPPTPPPAPPPPVPQAQPQAVTERLQQIWSTPHGFLRAARTNRASTHKVPQGTEVAFEADGRRYVGLINAKNLVDRVQTWVGNPVLGDMLVESSYRDYEAIAGGAMFPMHITQSQGGQVSLDLWVSSAQANLPLELTTPDTVRGAQPPAVRVESETIAEGVHYLRGGSHHSVAIEMRDHVVLVEAPLDEARSLAVLAKVRELAPGKAIRFVVNTHHHFDHSGGLRTLVNEGATVVTHDVNREFYQAAWAAPRTIGPDALERSRRSPVFQSFGERHVLTDGARTIELHRIANSPHHDGFAMVYLPAERLLIEADAYTPGPAAPTPPPGATPAPPAPGPPPGFGPPTSPTTLNLYENIRRLKLNVARIAALHGPRLATMDDLAKAVGKQEAGS